MKPIQLGSVITIQTPRREFRLKIVGVSTKAWIDREPEPVRVLN